MPLSLYDSGLSVFGRTLSVETIKNAADITLEPSGLTGGVELGRGDSDNEITYIRLKNSDGESCWIYPNPTQDAITVSNAKP